MPNAIDRQSLVKTLEDRYRTQRVGGSFDVKKTLGGPDAAPKAGDVMPVAGNENLYSTDDFIVKPALGVTAILDAQEANSSSSPKSKEQSIHMKGFSNKRYK